MYDNPNLTIDFNITNYCNSICPTCKRYRINYDTEKIDVHENLKVIHMNFNDFEKILLLNDDFFKEKRAQFCGEFGDPIMHPQLNDFIILSSDIFELLTINTNGGVKRKNVFDTIINIPKQNVEIVFSIDGTTHEINSIYRRNVNTKLSFYNMFNMIQKIGGDRIKWDFVVFKHNVHQVSEAIDIAKKNNIKLILKLNLRKQFGVLEKISEKQFYEMREIINIKNYSKLFFQDYYG